MSLKRTSTLSKRETTADREKSAKEKRADQLDFYRKHEEEFGGTQAKKCSHNRKVDFNKTLYFFAAVTEGNLDDVKAMQKEGIDLNIENFEGLTPLLLAVAERNIEMITYLINNGVNINCQDNEGWTPLHAVCSYGFFDVAKILVEKGADLSIPNYDNELPIDLIENSEEFTKFIKDAMAKQGITEEKAQEIRSGEEKQMLQDAELLLKNGTIDEQNEDGVTLLHIAASKGYQSVVLFLTENKANVNLVDNEGWSSLHCASYWERIDVLEPLVAFGGDLDLLTKNDETALDLAEDQVVREKLEMLREKYKRIKKEKGVKRHSSAMRRKNRGDREQFARSEEEDEFLKADRNT